MTSRKFLVLFFKIYFFKCQSYTDRGTNRDKNLASIGSLPRCLQWPEPSASSKFPTRITGIKVAGPSLAAFPRSLTGSQSKSNQNTDQHHTDSDFTCCATTLASISAPFTLCFYSQCSFWLNPKICLQTQSVEESVFFKEN